MFSFSLFNEKLTRSSPAGCDRVERRVKGIYLGGLGGGGGGAHGAGASRVGPVPGLGGAGGAGAGGVGGLGGGIGRG